MTFDSSQEVHNIHKVFPEAELVLRMSVVDTDAPNPFGKKFGAPREQWREILETCKEMKMKVRGVSFHCGTGGCSFTSYKSSLVNAETVFQMARDLEMDEMDYLDIGGGFSETFTNYSNPMNNFNIVAPLINEYLQEVFPGPNSKVQIIGEPGRMMCQGCQSHVVKVFLKKPQREVTHYYINSGVYHGFGSIIFDVEYHKPQLLIEDKEELKQRMSEEIMSYVWGQTCDGVDALHKNQLLPRLE
jgi:ornithine decarboxylase